jgi:dynein heavy chain 2
MRLSKNLHLVLSMDHTDPKFDVNCASNPALFTKCDIVWLNKWTPESMLNIARIELSNETLDQLQPKEKEDLF